MVHILCGADFISSAHFISVADFIRVKDNEDLKVFNGTDIKLYTIYKILQYTSVLTKFKIH